MKSALEKVDIQFERKAQRKQAKRQRRDEAKAARMEAMEKRLRDYWNFSPRTSANASPNDEADQRDEEAKRDVYRQIDELAARINAKIEADRAAGLETDLWEWLKGAPCFVTKALRERGIHFGKRKK